MNTEQEKISLAQNVHELILLIRGNPMDKKDIGLSGEVAQLRDEMTKMKDRDKVIYGGFLVLIFFAGAGVSPVFEFFGKLFK